MTEHKLLPTGTLAKRNAAFVCFHTDKYKHYLGADKGWGEKALNAEVVLFGAVVRWSGAIGFPGGVVEAGETLAQGAARECLEEVDYVVKPESLLPPMFS